MATETKEVKPVCCYCGQPPKGPVAAKWTCHVRCLPSPTPEPLPTPGSSAYLERKRGRQPEPDPEFDPEFEAELAEAKAFARRKVVRDYYVSRFKAGEDIDGMSAHARRWFEDMVDKQDAKDKAKRTGSCWFITVNPKDDIPLESTHKAILKACKKKYVDPAHTEWCYEVTDNVTRAPHAHMIVHLTEEKSASIIRREFGNTFKNIGAVDVKTNFTPEDQAKRRKYIRDVKAKPASQAKHTTHCIPWRKANGIKAIYTPRDITVN